MTRPHAAFLVVTWSARRLITSLKCCDAGNSKLAATLLRRHCCSWSFHLYRVAGLEAHTCVHVFVCLNLVFITRMEGKVIGPGPYRATKLVSVSVTLAKHSQTWRWKRFECIYSMCHINYRRADSLRGVNANCIKLDESVVNSFQSLLNFELNGNSNQID